MRAGRRGYERGVLWVAVLGGLWASLGCGGQLLEDRWASVYVGRVKVGYFHDVVEEVEENDRAAYHTMRQLVMATADGKGHEVELEFVEGTQGDPIRYSHGTEEGDVEKRLTYVFRSGRLRITQSLGGREQTTQIPFKVEVHGPMALRALRRRKGFEPGTEYTANVVWADSLGVPVQLDHVVRGPDSIDIGGSRREVHRVDIAMMTILDSGKGGVEPLGKKTIWLDDEGRELQSMATLATGVTTAIWAGEVDARAGMGGRQGPPLAGDDESEGE